MKLHNVLQGGDQWHGLRCGIPTASQFHRIVTPAKLQLASAADGYACEIVAERLGIQSPEAMPSFWMDYGMEMEPHAFAEFAATYPEAQAKTCGFITSDCGRWGCSPDGLAKNAVIEIKCPKVETLIRWHNSGEVPAEHWIQVQAEMWIAGVEFNHFWAWHPQLKPLHIVVGYDDKVFAAFDKTLPLFCEMVDEIERKVSKRDATVEVRKPARLEWEDGQ